MTNYIEFSAKIKEKYPQYKDVDDLTLAQKVIAKYPQYKEQVTFDEVKQEPKTKKGIDLTPSGLVDKAVNTINAGLETPVRMIKDKQNISDAFKSGYENSANIREQLKSLNPVMSKLTDFGTDMAVYSALPIARGGGVANFIKNAAIQGGLPGAVESLKRDGSPVGGAVGGTAFASALQSIPKVGNVLAKGGQKALELSGKLGQVKPETFKQVIKPESTALDMTAEDAGNTLYNLTKDIREKYSQLLRNKGEKVNEAVMKLDPEKNRFELKDLLGDIKGTFDKYQLDKANPARMLVGGLENDLSGMVKGLTENPAEVYKYVPESTSPYFSKEKMDEAFKILHAATGKPVNWLKSQLNAETFANGVGKRKEFIEGLVNNTDDKLANLGNEYFADLKHYNIKDLNDITAGREAAEQALDDIINRRFNVYNDDPLTMAINQADKGYNELLSKIAQNPREASVYESAYPELEKITKQLPDDLKGEYLANLNNALDDIYKKANTVSPLSLQGAKQAIGQLAKWGDETARGYAEPITEQIYGKFADRLSELSPELKAANKAYSDLAAFKKDDTVKQILKGNLLDGDRMGNAPSALKAYKSSINKESGARNLKDLETVLNKETGLEPFLNKVDDINAAMDLLKIENTGLGGLSGIAKAIITRPVLRGVRAANRADLSGKYQTLKDTLEPIAKLLPGLGAKGIANLITSGNE